MSESIRVNWSCPECGNVLSVRQNTNYFSCHICGSAFKLRWRGGQIIDHISLRNIKNVLEEGGSTAEVREKLAEKKTELQQLNNTIRKIEMSKSGERLKVLSLFALVCAAIYLLFRITVDGVRTFGDTNATDLVLAGVAGLAFMIFIVNGIYRNAMVRKVNKLLSRRQELEMDVNREEASLHIYGNPEDLEGGPKIQSKPQKKTVPEEITEPTGSDEKQETGEEKKSSGQDIIKDYADKKKERRRRLSLRDEE